MSRWRVVALVVVWAVVVAGVTTAVWATISSVRNRPVAVGQQVPTTTGWAPRQPGHSGLPTGAPSGQVGVDGGDGTWQGPGGLVVAVCDLETVRLVSAQPVDGFRVEIDDEPDALEVTFEGHGRGSPEVKVYARCESGIPVFTAKTDD